MSESGALYDSNVWVALVFPSHPLHWRATDALNSASPSKPALFCRATELSFLRLISTPALQVAYGTPSISNRDALVCFDRFLELPQVSWCEENEAARELWRKLAALATPSPKLWMDAYLAACSIASGVRLTSGDRYFVSLEKEGLDLDLLEA